MALVETMEILLRLPIGAKIWKRESDFLLIAGFLRLGFPIAGLRSLDSGGFYSTLRRLCLREAVAPVASSLSASPWEFLGELRELDEGSGSWARSGSSSISWRKCGVSSFSLGQLTGTDRLAHSAGDS
ncbi:hypothetical protein F2Q68_00042990 [Brassica cretica]|uniref:Uncharacterized protein n=1 Tax=Brassica cretica TaxID=69181 RepID=A0A8S9LNR6_BRACR|nr:hypothetical protein F2Q68_00042990 [Brassica cretica]